MNPVTISILRATCPTTPIARLELFVEPLNVSIEEFGVGEDRVAAFVAQWAYETQGFQKLEESLRYSAKRMAEVWRRRYASNPDERDPKKRQPNDLAIRLAAAGPVAIANDVYANRGGNGDFASGDGWKFRGRGAPHLTFRGNYAGAEEGLGIPIVENPDLLLEPLHACRAGGWFWKTNGCEKLLDWPHLTQRINGVPDTAPLRLPYLERTLAAITDPDSTQPPVA